MIPLFSPYINSSDIISGLRQVLKQKSLSQGEQVEQFESEISRFCNGVNRGVATDSGTSALHLAYILAGIKEGDEVLTPVLTCVATNIPLLYLKAKPVFVDINPKDLNMDVNDIEKKITEKTKAIIVVHFGGIPADIEQIYEIAKKYNLVVIEDAAQALGATYHGRKIGGFGDFVVFSFQAVKTLTTIDGGMLMMHDDKMIDRAKKLRWFGIDRNKKIERDNLTVWPREITYDIDEFGYKYNMNNVTATIGLANLKKLDEVLTKRAAIAEYYTSNLQYVPGLTLLSKDEGKISSNWIYQVLVTRRDDFQRKLKENDIETNVAHTRNDIYKIFEEKRLDLSNMNQVELSYICLPVHNLLTFKDLKKIVDVIKKGW